MNASATLTALVAAITIAGTGTLVYAQTSTDSATTSSATESAAPRNDATLPSEANRRALPPDLKPSPLPNASAMTAAPGYSAGVTTTYPMDSANTGSASTALTPAPALAPEPSGKMSSGTTDSSTGARATSSSEPLPRADRN